jgi:transcriptional regulator GlxA family with amidase domain
MNIALFFYPDFTLLDAIGPAECLSMLPGAKLYTVAPEQGMIKTDNGMQIYAEYSIQQIDSADILLIPGGLHGTKAICNDMAVLEWIGHMDKHTTYMCSVCTGAWIMAAAGLLKGNKACTHWYGRQLLEQYNVQYNNQRYMHSGKYWTSAGVSAGIDMAIALAAHIAGDRAARAIQLGLEYDPAPPFNAGTPEKADAELVQSMKLRFDSHLNKMQ